MPIGVLSSYCIALFRYKLLRKQRNKSIKVQRIHIFTIFVQR